MHNISKITAQAIVHRYQVDRRTVNAIGKEFGLSSHVVNRVLRDEGVRFRNRKREREERDKKVLALTDRTAESIGKEFGISAGLVRHIRRKAGVNIPRRDEAQFKKAIELYTSRHLSAVEVANQLGIPDSTVKRWIREAQVSRRRGPRNVLAILEANGVQVETPTPEGEVNR
ncbi:hypothetical protein [Streptomyces sp. NPDC045369]|uniref:hypothetical protein n=1 Tax=Streptomyces sp. NPDC045369 TaxID=3155732 RepID=UPI0033FF267F